MARSPAREARALPRVCRARNPRNLPVVSFRDELWEFYEIQKMAEPFRMAYMRRHAPAHLQRRNGHK